MASAGEKFRMAMGKWADKAGTQLEGLARQSIQNISRAVVEQTPVDTGFLRGNWQPAIGEAKVADPDTVEHDVAGALAAAAISLTVAEMKLGDVFRMRNGCAYARRLEYGFVGPDSLGRVYNQAGRFYVRDTLLTWPQVVSNTAKDLKL
jgi:hypothetical protein